MADQQLRILIVGGYGFFGSRLARLLADEDGLTILLAGRSKSNAEAFCRTVAGRAAIIPEVFDRDSDVEGTLKRLHPDIVVDAAGPFQNYGENPYRIVEAAWACGADYTDLADATDFVCGIGRLDRSARERGRFAISGASTCPALTAAVVRHLAADLAGVVGVEGGVAPSPHVRVGLNVIAALASYAGRPLRLLQNGKETGAVAVVDSRRHVVAPPGVPPLDERLFSLIDVPELRLLPAAWPELKSIWFGAGTAPVVEHRIFVLLAWLSSAGVLGPLGRLAPLMHRIRDLPARGDHRGGMYVVVDGLGKQGAPVRRSWDMIAEGDDGPFIPAMAAAAIIRNCRTGRRPAPGARPASQELEYGDFEYFFAQKKIATGIRDL